MDSPKPDLSLKKGHDWIYIDNWGRWEFASVLSILHTSKDTIDPDDKLGEVEKIINIISNTRYISRTDSRDSKENIAAAAIAFFWNEMSNDLFKTAINFLHRPSQSTTNYKNFTNMNILRQVCFEEWFPKLTLTGHRRSQAIYAIETLIPCFNREIHNSQIINLLKNVSSSAGQESDDSIKLLLPKLSKEILNAIKSRGRFSIEEVQNIMSYQWELISNGMLDEAIITF